MSRRARTIAVLALLASAFGAPAAVAASSEPPATTDVAVERCC